MDREKIIKDLKAYRDMDFIREGITVFDSDPRYRKMIINNALALLKEDCHNCKLECLLQKYDELKEKYDALLKEQEELLKHEYWRGYNNGRADERGLQEGTIMQTFSPD